MLKFTGFGLVVQVNNERFLNVNLTPYRRYI